MPRTSIGRNPAQPACTKPFHNSVVNIIPCRTTKCNLFAKIIPSTVINSISTVLFLVMMVDTVELLNTYSLDLTPNQVLLLKPTFTSGVPIWIHFSQPPAKALCLGALATANGKVYFAATWHHRGGHSHLYRINSMMSFVKLLACWVLGGVGYLISQRLPFNFVVPLFDSGICPEVPCFISHG